jgi:hypothetical protein
VNPEFRRMDNREDKRKTDTEPDNVAHFRAGSRIFRLNDEWYFSSREGEHGPFQTEQDAVMELETYVKLAGVPEAEEDSPFELVEEPALKPTDPKVWDRFDNFN